MLAQLRNTDETETSYTSVTDFAEIFAEEMRSLYLLSFFLMANKDKAEQCFVGAFGDCVEGIDAFRNWSRQRARRATIKQATRMIGPAYKDTDDWSVDKVKEKSSAPKGSLFAAVISLQAFERFVFVMSVLERQSDGDCLSLLKCSRREIKIARELVLSFLTTIDTSGDQLQEAAYSWRACLSLDYPA